MSRTTTWLDTSEQCPWDGMTVEIRFSFERISTVTFKFLLIYGIILFRKIIQTIHEMRWLRVIYPEGIQILAHYIAIGCDKIYRFLRLGRVGMRRALHEWNQQKLAELHTRRIKDQLRRQAYSEEQRRRQDEIYQLNALADLPLYGSEKDLERRRNEENFRQMFRGFDGVGDE